MAHDPRPSLEERYGSLANYMTVAKAAAASLMAQGYLLPNDATVAVKYVLGRAVEAGVPSKPTAP
jgi:hypothetical protein